MTAARHIHSPRRTDCLCRGGKTGAGGRALPAPFSDAGQGLLKPGHAIPGGRRGPISVAPDLPVGLPGGAGRRPGLSRGVVCGA